MFRVTVKEVYWDSFEEEDASAVKVDMLLPTTTVSEAIKVAEEELKFFKEADLPEAKLKVNKTYPDEALFLASISWEADRDTVEPNSCWAVSVDITELKLVDDRYWL